MRRGRASPVGPGAMTRWVSTRGAAPAVGFTRAILDGLAPDGGLYVPERFPRFDPDGLDAEGSFPELAVEVLRPFLAGDPLAAELEAIAREAFDFELPLVDLPRETAVLELFWGPTAAFKDFGARFLSGCFDRALRRGEDRARLTVLVATSGDTGAAVAAACHRRPGIDVGVLFPATGVSPRQRHQLTCWDENVRSFAVRGTFDDCQRLVKAAFRDEAWRARGPLSSANSINVGRLLPQLASFAAASLWYRRRHGVPASFIVPSGNAGNAVGAFWARRVGFPIARIVMAHNANRVVPDWFAGGAWRPRPSVPTLANAMDVGDPSNMERLFALHPDPEALRREARAFSVDDATIRAVIAEGPARWGRVWCPHTATAVHVRESIGEPHQVIVATAHPAKFDEIVEPLIGRGVELPPSLAELLARPARSTTIEPDLAALHAAWSVR